MKILTQLGIIFAVCLAGNVVSALLPFPFPASVAAMVILFLLLLTGAVKPARLGESSDFLLKNMAILFIPSGVGILEQYAFVREHILKLAAICLITTLLTFVVTAFTVLGVIRLQKRRKAVETDG